MDLFHSSFQAICDYAKDGPAFRFTSDGAHPYPHGHLLMARKVLQELDPTACPEDITANPTPLLSRVAEKNDVYFHRWREVQIPAMLANTLERADVQAELAKFDKEIAQLEAEIDMLRNSSTRPTEGGSRRASIPPAVITRCRERLRCRGKTVKVKHAHDP